MNTRNVWGTQCGKAVCFLVTIFLTFALRTQAQTMSSGNSTATVNPTSQSGLYSWTIDGAQDLNVYTPNPPPGEWFWYAVGTPGGTSPPSTAPASIDTLALTSDTQPTANTLNLSYVGGSLFTIGVGYTLTGGSPGSGTADLEESISIHNTTAFNLPFSFYEYTDFDLDNSPGPDTVSLSQSPLGGYNGAYQMFPTAPGPPVVISETVTAPMANYGETANEFTTLAELNNGVSPVVLDDNATAGPGDVTWALQWNFNIAPDSTVLISKDKLIAPIPEPSTLALAGLSGLSLMLFRRQRK